MKTQIEIVSEDGRTFFGYHYSPSPDVQNGASVIINSALGVKQSFYDDFALHLAALGNTVVTWDPRSVGESATLPIKSDPAKLSDWGVYDLESVLKYVEENAIADLSKTTILGHSAGAQIVGLSRSIHKVRNIIIVASGSGYWRLYPFKEQIRLLMVWYLLMPIVLKTLGYVPGSFGLGHDLPRNILEQWRRWCLHPEYLFSEETLNLENYETYSGKISAIGFSDDNDFSPRRTALKLLGYFPAATTDYKYVEPNAFGLLEIGHFGFFKKKNATLWPIIEVLLK